MKFRPLLLSGAWIFSGVLLLVCAGTAFYVLLASAEPVKPPSSSEKTFLSAGVVQDKDGSGDIEEGIPGAPMPGPTVDLSKADSKMKQANIRLGRDGVQLPMLTAPNLQPGRSGNDPAMAWGPEASNPVPYNEGDNASPEELNAQRETQRADREKRRYDSLNERIVKLEERLAKVKTDNPEDEQIDRLQKSIERLQKRREDLKREMDSRPEPAVY